ncbi:MAG: hypothetical protein IJ251_01705 [Oscillospiraceae bacterium]|nr:hypothetical protein [Oscillospiraceae bacterium]
MSDNLLFPLPLPIHIGFVVLTVILMGICWFKRRRLYELLIIIGVVSTLFVYVCARPPYFYILGIEEIAIFVWACIDMHKVYKQLDGKASENKPEEEKDEDEDSSS